MTDTIIKGTGNSRTLKTVPNAAALYPNFDAFLAAMVAGTLPIDLGPLNPTGVQVQGTDLTKGNLLTDETAEMYGKSGTATLNEILVAIRALITQAHNAVRISSGYYTGDGTANKDINIGFRAKAFFVFPTESEKSSRDSYSMLFGAGDNLNVLSGNSGYSPSWHVDGSITDTKVSLIGANVSGITYYYIAIG